MAINMNDYINSELERINTFEEKLLKEIETAKLLLQHNAAQKEFIMKLKDELTAEEPKVEERKKELVYNTKCAKVGRFDPKGNQLNIWYSQKVAADAMGMTQGNLSYIMKKVSVEKQIKKRGYYFAWIH